MIVFLNSRLKAPKNTFRPCALSALLREHMLSVAGMFLVLIVSSCASQQLENTVERIDVMEAELNTPPPPPPENGKTLGPNELLETAEKRGRDFLQARISRARAVLELDETKSGRYPRVSAEARSISTYRRSDDDGVQSVSNIVLGVNWDVSRALLRLDGNEVRIAGELIPVQYQIAQRNAIRGLIEVYDEYTALDFKQKEVSLEAEGLQCDVDRTEVEVVLGNASESELDALNHQIDAAEREVVAVSRALNSKRNELLGLAGLSEGGYGVAAGRSPQDALSAYPSVSVDDAEVCFDRSGKKRLENLLVEAAGAQLDRAKQSRLTKLKTSIPSFMTQTGGFNLQFLVSYVLPLIDQGDALRITQNARLALVETILTARDNRRSFMSSFEGLQVSLASAESDLAAARTARAKAKNALQHAGPADRCSFDVDLRKAQNAMTRAEYKIEVLRGKLRLLCAPLSEKTMDIATAARTPSIGQ